MDIGNVILDPTLTMAGVAGAAAAGLVTWWLVRKRQKRVWLPTIRIMRLESRILPRLVLRPPPLIGFLCFLTAALVMTGFAMRPRTQVFTPFEPNQTRIHIFADMSASVSAYVSLDDYVQRVSSLYANLKEAGRVTVSTSHGPTVYEPQSEAELAQTLKQAGFHRGGLRLGAALKVLLEELGEADRLFIVSDRDQHSWTGFNWQYLLDDMDVAFLDVGGSAQPKNLFVNDARFLSAPSSPTMEWDVEVARRAGGDEVDGKLSVTYMGKALGTFPWKMPAGKQRIDVRAEWPATATLEIDPTGARDVPLVFRIEVEGDALAADNEFRAALLGLKQDVLVIGETFGERILEDPVGELGVALEILGFRQKRYDFLVQPGPKPDEYPFVVIAGGTGNGVDRFCPKSIEAARIAVRSKQGAKDGRHRAMPKVWLAPYALDADYRELCQCYARLMTTTSTDAPEPSFCEHVQSRANWVGLLPSLGAKQIGGELGDESKSLAFHGKDAGSGLEVLAFTVPLMPLRATGLSHAQMPVLIKELLTWQGLIEAKSGMTAASWPRVEDVTTKLWRKDGDAPVDPADLSKLSKTNVPLGESLLAEADPSTLPPRWTAQNDWSDKQLPAKKDREDPLPWLKLAALLVLGVTALEGVLVLGYKIARFVGRPPQSAALLLAALGAALLGAPKAEAKVEFNLLGYADPPTQLGSLAREVAHRTSIEVAAKPNVFSAFSVDTLAEPWVWVRDPAAITDSTGRLKPELVLWLKRGGFLVLETPLPAAQLQKMTEALTDNAEGWLPLPPDHEMMRSFYLLDALPGCNEEIWRGFHYDGRLAILMIPYPFLASLKDRAAPPACQAPPDQERSVRIFVNLIMVALATDYKKDQIHLPEILKRLR